MESAVDMVRETFRRKDFSVRRGGRFAVLNGGNVRRAVRAVIEKTPRVGRLPMDDDASHAGISGYGAADLAASRAEHARGGGDDSPWKYAAIEAAVAGRIADLVSGDGTYAGVAESGSADGHPPRRVPHCSCAACCAG